MHKVAIHTSELLAVKSISILKNSFDWLKILVDFYQCFSAFYNKVKKENLIYIFQ